MGQARIGTENSEFAIYTHDSIAKLQILVQPSDWKKIEGYRVEALRAGVHVSGEDPWIPAKIVSDGKVMPARIRLKGDWVDHLLGGKWSFRVEVKDGGAWKNKIVFSIQSPTTRNYMAEWLFHQFLEEIDVLTTSYDFVNVSINHSNKGIYAYEEHFQKQLIESRRRREGPIIKMSEEGIWNLRQYENSVLKTLNVHKLVRGSSEVRPFNPGKTVNDTVLGPQFRAAATLLRQYMEEEVPAREVFDLHQLAKFLVATDMFRSYHGLYWHNLRFYYNPVTSLLEPIGFDGNCSFNWNIWLKRSILAEKFRFGATPLKTILQKEPGFRDLYYRYLEEYTSDKFLNDFIDKRKTGIETREEWISRDYPGYDFNYEGFIDHAKYLRESFVKKWSNEKEANG